MTNEELMEKMSDGEILTLTIYGEARGESVEGQIAVANVIKNRAKNRNQSIKQVCLAKWQFSCWNDNDPNRPILVEMANKLLFGEFLDKELAEIKWVVSGVLGNKLRDNVRGRDHYMTSSLFNSEKRPSWAKMPKNDPIVIGRHTFLNV